MMMQSELNIGTASIADMGRNAVLAALTRISTLIPYILNIHGTTKNQIDWKVSHFAMADARISH